MKPKLIIPIALLLVSCGISDPRPSPGTESPHVVVADKGKLDGQKLSVFGYLVLEESTFQIFDNADSYKRKEYASHCVSLLISQSNFEQFRRYSKSFVVVSGQFRTSISASGRVHLGGCNDVGLEVTDIRLIR